MLFWWSVIHLNRRFSISTWLHFRTKQLFQKFAKITQMHKNPENAHVNKAQILICPIKHLLKKNTKAFIIKITCIAECGGFSDAFPADFLIKRCLTIFAHHRWTDYTHIWLCIQVWINGFEFEKWFLSLPVCQSPATLDTCQHNLHYIIVITHSDQTISKNKPLTTNLQHPRRDHPPHKRLNIFLDTFKIGSLRNISVLHS